MLFFQNHTRLETCLVIVAGIFMPVRFILYGRFRTPM